MQSCYLAGPGIVDEVNILREGTDGAEMKVVPSNPVVVELVKERYCFVASRDVLFESKEAAGIEAERLRIADAEIRRRRKEIQKMIDAMDSNQDGTDGTEGTVQATQPNLVLVGAPPDEVTIEVDTPPEVINIEPEPPGEIVVEDTNPTSPTNFVKNLQRVIGNETVEVEEIHTRLKAAGLMPDTSNPTQYIRWQISQHRNLFERGSTRSCFHLTDESGYHDQPWGVKKIEAEAKKPKAKKPKVTEGSSTKAKLPLGTKKKAKKAEAKPAKAKKEGKEKPKKSKPSKPVPTLQVKEVYLTWMGNPMAHSSETEATFTSKTMILFEQKRGDSWTCKITLSELKREFVGKSPRRDLARNKALGAASEIINPLTAWLYLANHPDEE